MSGNRPSKKSKSKTTGRKLSDTVIVAIIGTIGTVLVAVITIVPQIVQSDSPKVITATPLTKIETATLVDLTDTSQPASTLTLTSSNTPTLTSTPSNTPTATLTRTFTPKPIDTFTATSSSQTDQMTASLVANLDTGNAPVNIGFNARDSSVQFANGGSEICGNTPFCSYVFTIRLGSQQVHTESNNSGRITYNFTQKGQYTIVVNVCRGNACDYAFVTVEIK